MSRKIISIKPLLQAMAERRCDLLSKFRGTLVGGLVGDCFGSPFEGESKISKSVLTNYLNKSLIDNEKVFKQHSYTDDSVMTKSVAESLIELNGVNELDLAKRFVDDYYNQPKRGYGQNVTSVFENLLITNFKDLFQPAKIQFNGTGSYGNGAAMRIAPIALFSYKLTKENLVDLVTNSSMITHSNILGINGAILQSMAILRALQVNKDNFSSIEFIDDLIESMRFFESNEDSQNEMPFTEKLVQVKNLLTSESVVLTNTNPGRIVDVLGNSVTALKSVPTAIYTFLRSQEPIDEFQTDNVFLRNLYLSISIGGDTDTIASMSSSILGACHGIESIPTAIVKRCESNELFSSLADQLYERVIMNQ